MTRVALRGLLGRKLRSALTAMAIVLGVAMIAGTYVLTDTINGSFSTLYQDIYKGTDAFIQAKSAVKTSNSNGVVPPSFPESMLTRVQAVKDVKVAIGGVSSYPVSVVGKNGKIIVNGGAPNLGFSIDTTPQFNSLSLVSGKWPRPDELVIDVSTAKKSGYKIGDMVPIIANGPERKMRLSGIVRFGNSNGILGATLAGFDLRTAQQLFGKVGQFDSIQVAAKSGVTPEQLVSELKAALPSMVVRTGEAQIKKDTSDTSAQISIFRDFLLAFAGIALFVGIFVIVNSLSITIAQRTREFATLRTLGASRTQVLLSILAESAIVGAIASVLGLFVGFGLARFLLWFFGRLGLELPPNAMVIQTRTVVVALVVGIVVTLFASLRPAVRATRVPPIAAVREGATLPPSRFHRFRIVGSTALVALGFLSLLYGLFAHGLTTKQILLSIGVGALLVFIGTSLVSARFVAPLAKIVSPVGKWAVAVLSLIIWPFSVLLWTARHAFGNGTEFPSVLPDKTMTKLALENAIRGKQRTASTAAALMIGLALVTLVAVFASSLTASFKGAVNSIITGDYAITAENNFQPIPIAASLAAAKAPGVEAIANVRAGNALVFGKTSFVTAVDPGAAQVMRLNWKDGSNATLGRLGVNGAVVDDSYAKTHHLRLGSPISIVTPTGQQLTFMIKGIFKPPTGGSPFGPVTFSASVFDRAFQNPQNLYTLVKMHGGETPANTKALDRALASFPNAKSQTRQQFIDNQIAPLNRALMVLYVLLAFSVLISFFGIVNTLVLTVFERTRELGMLRAIGTTQRQARRMIRHESVITALIGAALGIALGLIFGGLLVDRIRYVQFSLPGAQLIVFALAAVIVGIVAAIFPARRAARLNILEALQYE
jgi:putative ABC transport system permease protein